MIDKEDMIYPSGDGYVVSLNPSDVPPSHKALFDSMIHVYVDDQKRVFVHGGFNPHAPVRGQYFGNYMWDRDLWKAAIEGKDIEFHDDIKEVFLGHTATTYFDPDTKEHWKYKIILPDELTNDGPMNIDKIWNVDTGAGGNGRLTIMNVDTKEYWQSDKLKDLYEDEWAVRLATSR